MYIRKTLCLIRLKGLRYRYLSSNGNTRACIARPSPLITIRGALAGGFRARLRETRPQNTALSHSYHPFQALERLITSVQAAQQYSPTRTATAAAAGASPTRTSDAPQPQPTRKKSSSVLERRSTFEPKEVRRNSALKMHRSKLFTN